MLYNQPFDKPSEPDAPYVNGNASTGVAGSIPSAASIEYDQREIVNFITDSSITPSNGDLHQLAKGVQCGKVCYGADIGAANSIVVSLVPTPIAYQAGMTFRIKVAATNTGATVVNVNSLGSKNVVRSDGTALRAKDISVGEVVELTYDGTNFQLRGGTRALQAVYWRFDTPNTTMPSGVNTQITSWGRVFNGMSSNTTLSNGTVTIGAGDAGIYIMTAICATHQGSPGYDEWVSISVNDVTIANDRVQAGQGNGVLADSEDLDRSTATVAELFVGDVVKMLYFQKNTPATSSPTADETYCTFSGARFGIRSET